MRQAIIIALCIAATVASGDWRRGLVLNGSSEYASIDASQLPLGADARSVSIWFKANTISAGDYESIFSYGNTGAGIPDFDKMFEILIGQSNKIYFHSNGYLPQIGTVSAGVWYNVAVSYTGSRVIAYMDGVEGLDAAHAINTTSVAGFVGRSAISIFPRYFDGVIASTLIHNRALSAAEVLGLYNETVAVTSEGASVEVPRAWIGTTNSLVLDLDMPESYDSGATVAEVLDTSPSANHGTLEPSQSTGPTWQAATRSGAQGGEYGFDGTEDWIDLPNLLAGDDDFSITLWMKTTTTTAGQLAVGSSVDNRIYMGYRADSLFSFRKGDAAGLGAVASDTDWHHAALTYNDASGEVIAYIDGEVVGTETDTTSATPTQLNIGSFGDGSASWFSGMIDAVRVDLSTLTSNQVYQLAVNDVTPTNTPVLNMPFDYASDRMLNNGSAGGTAVITGTPDVSTKFNVPSPRR